MRLKTGYMVALVVILLGGCFASGAASPSQLLPTPAEHNQADTSAPSIVLVLMDDFSMDLLRTMPAAQRMINEGASYPNAFVDDSLCCVSRTSIFTGQYPYQHGVYTNTSNLPNPVGPVGGWPAFLANGDEERSFNVRLQEAGYTTGFVGKYLNQYENDPDTGQFPSVPPGWSDFRAIFGGGYQGWNFASTYVDDGEVKLQVHPAPPNTAAPWIKDRAYVGTFTQSQALDFIGTHRDDSAPYFLEVSTYAPHPRVSARSSYPGDPIFPAAFRDRPKPGLPEGNCGAVTCDQLGLADLPGFNDPRDDNAPKYADGTPAPPWRVNRVTLTAHQAVEGLRNRARMVQSVDRMLSQILDSVGPNTYVVLTSDNGFHLGQHQLERGKGTPYDSDVHVPLVVTGPGVAVGERREVAMNIDLAPTFEQLAGLTPAAYRTGISLVPSLEDPSEQERTFAFFQHTWARAAPAFPQVPGGAQDPDSGYGAGTLGTIPSYVAVRGPSGLLVRLDLDNSWDGVQTAWEFYDYSELGWEKTNTYGDPQHLLEITRLKEALARFDECAAPYEAGGSRDADVPESCREVRVPAVPKNF